MIHASRVAVFGEALLDAMPDREVLGGAPFNVARNLAALGADALLLTRVGRDADGVRILDEMQALGMDTGGVQHDATHATGRVTVRLRDGDPHFEIGADAAWDHIEAGAVAQAVRAASPAWFYFGTLAQRSPASRAALRAGLEAGDARGFLDLNLRGSPGEAALAEESLALADVVKVNEDELARVMQWFAPGDMPAALLQRFGLARLVVTRGARGWRCHDADGSVLEGDAPATVVRDTLGAGDAFVAVILLGLLRDMPLAQALRYAAAFASGVCTLRGAFERGAPLYANLRLELAGVSDSAR